MQKFKIGDKVRVNRGSNVGTVGIIRQIHKDSYSDSGRIVYQVDLMGSDRPYMAEESMLRKY